MKWFQINQRFEELRVRKYIADEKDLTEKLGS